MLKLNLKAVRWPLSPGNLKLVFTFFGSLLIWSSANDYLVHRNESSVVAGITSLVILLMVGSVKDWWATTARLLVAVVAEVAVSVSCFVWRLAPIDNAVLSILVGFGLLRKSLKPFHKKYN